MSAIFLLLFGPALVFFIVALVSLVKKKKKRAKIFFILTGVYLLISLGTCGIMLANLSLDVK